MSEFTGGRKRIIFLLVLMAATTLAVGLLSSSFLFNAALSEEKIRLTEIVQSQARLIEAVYRFDQIYSEDYPEGSLQATISQLQEAHKNYGGFGRTGEFTLARLEDDQIVFLFPLRHQKTDEQLTIPMDSGLAEPQQLALSGKSGIVIGRDYRGERVLAAFEPVAGIDLGIVAKIDLAEIRMPYLRAGIYTFLASFMILLGGSILFLWVGNPILELMDESVEALRQSEEKFRSAFEGSNVGMALIDRTGRYIQINPTMEKLLGYTEEEMLGMRISDITYPGDMNQESPQIREMWEGKRDSIHFEKRFICKDGSVVWGLTSASTIRNAVGENLYLLGQFQDITKRKEAERDIQNLNENLEQLVKERTTQLESFSYSVSHDLRAPLRTITGFSHLLVEEYEDQLDGTAQDYFHRIIQACSRMDRLIDDLLALSRQGQQGLHPEKLDLAKSAQRIMTIIQEQQLDRELKFMFKLDSKTCPQIVGDQNLLDIVLTNLLSNAVKFTQGENPAVIEFGCFIENEEIVFYIQDNGVGFDMSYSDKLFLPFQRLHGQEFEGNGIGLAMVEQIIRRHNGRIWVEAEPGVGTKFFFTLGDIVKEES